MTKYGSNYERERRRFKDECAARNDPCWICNGRLGAIDYVSVYTRGATPQPLLFNLDHAVPTSLGGEMVRYSNFRPAHYVCNVGRGNTTRGLYPNSREW